MYCIVSGKERTEWISNGKRACWTYACWRCCAGDHLMAILKRLEANGYVTTDTQEHGGRIRRYFYITDAGQERIDAFLDEWDEVKRIYAFIKGEEV